MRLIRNVSELELIFFPFGIKNEDKDKDVFNSGSWIDYLMIFLNLIPAMFNKTLKLTSFFIFLPFWNWKDPKIKI